MVDQLVCDYSNVMAELISEKDPFKVRELQKQIQQIVLDLEELGFRLFVAPMTIQEFKARYKK